MKPLLFIDGETEAQGRTCLARLPTETVGNRPGTQAPWLTVWPPAGLFHATCPLLTWGVHLDQAAPLGLSPKPASAAPGKRHGHLRTGTKEPPVPEPWTLFDPYCPFESPATAWLQGLRALVKEAPHGSFPGISTHKAECSRNEQALAPWLPPIFHSLMLRGVNN